ncbi:MAG: Abi-alpha family protein [Nevskia sp.]|nr:Abi-alpha family protein [Nevskia sp.]
MSDKERGFSAGALANRVLKRLPGGGFAQEQYEKIERRLLSELKQRLDKVERSATVSVLAFSVEAEPAQARKRGRYAPGELLRELLDISGEQTHDEALQAYYVAALKSLVPDEARILSALSDSSGFPLLHVMAGSRLGGATHPVLQNVSNVGKVAGAQLIELTPTYIRRLRDWELVQTLGESAELKTSYEILETDDAVRRAVERVRKGGQRDVILRRTLKMSDLGRALWAACRISED